MATILAPASGECLHAHEAMEPSVHTVAGVGSPGTADGGALNQASFIEPTAVAVASDGSIYVADASAQNIRRIANGTVSTVAGSSKPGPSPEQRIGGYLDGPASSSEFDRPTALAIDRDGAIYVADSLNGAIRKIKDGQVSTLVKGLDSPRALAFDDDGTLYVGDHGSGVRTVSLRDGSLSAFGSVGGDTRDVCGMSVKGSGKHRILAYTDGSMIHVVEGSEKRDVAFDAPVEPVFESKRMGEGCAVHILDRNNLLVSDLIDNSVRLLRLPLEGAVGEGPVARAITSGREGQHASFGGYADGPASTALSDVPGDFATMKDGSVLFADSGNRRIRRIDDLDLREVVSADESGQLAIPTPAPPASNYRIVFIGNSFAFTDALWIDSAPGQIEQGLIADRDAIGLSKCPDVTAYRLSGTSVTTAADFVSTYYADGQADLVIFIIDAYNVEKDIQVLQKAMPSVKPASAIFSPGNYYTGWRDVLPRRLKALRDELAKSNTKLALVTIPDGRAVSNLENLQGNTLQNQLRDLYTDASVDLTTFKMANDLDRVFEKSDVHMIELLKPMIRAEEGTTRTPLYGTQDDHPSPAGNTVIGRIIKQNLANWRPWATSSR